jgi:uncharacterized protein (DUF2249 family)
MTQTAVRIDVQSLPPHARHSTIFATFNELATGQALELVNNHDPRPLFFQFQNFVPGQFDWSYLEQGPETWRVAIKRTSGGSAYDGGSSCCGGGCGG